MHFLFLTSPSFGDTYTTYKFVSVFLSENDIYVNGISNPVSLSGTWEDYYSACLYDNLGDWENHPAGTFMNWLTFPEVVATCAADATWQEYWDED